MANPKQKRTKSARNQRRSNHALKKINLTKCGKCKEPLKPHHVCSNCGYYKGMKVAGSSESLSAKDTKNKQETKSPV